MSIDNYGIAHYTSDEMCDTLYRIPQADLAEALIDDPEEFNASVQKLFYSCTTLKKYTTPDISVEEFDIKNQDRWFMPIEYRELDIVKWVLDQCKTDPELQRVGEELLLFQSRDMIPLLRFMKYFVDTLRANKLVWGVGRGSSVSSYVLYLIGVHRVNSMFYDLDIREFLKPESIR